MKISTRAIAFFGVIGALCFVVLLLETQVFAAILPVSPCFLSLPLALSVCLMGDIKQSVGGGLVLGLCSLVLSLIFPQFLAFLNPLVSVLPRVLAGLAAYGAYRLFAKIFRKAGKFFKDSFSLGVGGAVGAISNTVLVVFALYVFRFTGIEDALATVLSVNALIELVCSAMLVPLIVPAVKASRREKE